jgi:hypothetical protein
MRSFFESGDKPGCMMFYGADAATLDMCLVADTLATPSLNESRTVPRAAGVHDPPQNPAEKNQGRGRLLA